MKKIFIILKTLCLINIFNGNVIECNLNLNGNNFLELPMEIKLKIIKSKIEDIIKHNHLFHPLNGINDFLKEMSLASKDLNAIITQDKVRLKQEASEYAKEWFANEESKLTQKQLDEKLKNILEDNYNQEKEKEAAKLIIAGANPNMIINVKILEKLTSIPLLIFIAQTGDFVNLINVLLDFKANINIKDVNGKTPLRLAVTMNKENIAKLLIDRGANVNAKDKFQESIIQAALSRNNYNIIKLLIDKGADVFVKDRYNKTTLMLAAIQGNENIARVLIEKGVDINAKDKWGKTARSLALDYKNMNVVKLIDSVEKLNKKNSKI